jgi:hypothetical protein
MYAATMKVKELALQAAAMRAWPSRQDSGDGDVRVEIPTVGGRTQVVVVTAGQDGDGDPAGIVWSKAADMGAQDPWALLRLNAQLTYGKVALRGHEIVIVHGMHDASATLADVGKAMFWAARAADELEAALGGADSL